VLLLVSCAAPRGLVPLEETGPVGWADDADRDSLAAAIDRSIEYYGRLPESTLFRYGDLVYSAGEMARSHQLFLRLWHEAPDGEAFARRLEERFHVFESIALEGENLFTGYFEPVIEGRDAPQAGLNTPIYAEPQDLVRIDLSRFAEDLPPRVLVGRVREGRVVPYFSRREIQEGRMLEGRAEPLAYVNEVDLFFLQIQGSGIVRFPDGRRLRVNYAGSNGHPYRAIGAELIRQEELSREEVTLQTIRKYLEENPEAVRPLLFSNPSYTFFNPVEEGPLGNIRVPLTPGRSLALDHRLFPRGGLAYVESETAAAGDPESTRSLRRFMVVQDTGGVIRGHGRADVFWGNGPEAEWAAGHMKHPGRLLLLVAKKPYIRANGEEPDGRAAHGSLPRW
jgi:membrane-bound lytic murein transglycosylase A